MAGIEAAIVIFFGIVYYFLIKYKVEFAQNKQALAKSITIILASVISAVTVFIAAFHKI